MAPMGANTVLPPTPLGTVEAAVSSSSQDQQIMPDSHRSKLELSLLTLLLTPGCSQGLLTADFSEPLPEVCLPQDCHNQAPQSR